MIFYDFDTASPDLNKTRLERKTGTTFAHFMSRMQNYALKTRMLEYIDTIEKLHATLLSLRSQSNLRMSCEELTMYAATPSSMSCVRKCRRCEARRTSLTPITLQLNKLTVPMCLNPMR